MRKAVTGTGSASRAASLGSSYAAVCDGGASARLGAGPVSESKRIFYGFSATGHISARDRSTVENELALRPGHSPPGPNATIGATCAPRRGPRIIGFDCGAGFGCLRRYAADWVDASQCD